MRKLITLHLTLYACLVFGQADTLYLSQLVDGVSLDSYARYEVASKETPIGNFISGNQLNSSYVHDSAIFIEFYVSNDIADSSKFYLNLSGNEFWQLQELSPKEDPIYSYCGTLEAQSKFDISFRNYFFDIELITGEVKRIRLKTFNKSTKPVYGAVEALTEIGFYKLNHSMWKRSLWGSFVSILFVGAVLIMMCYMFLLYFQSRRDRTYLYYGLYLFSALMYMLPKLGTHEPYFFLFEENPIIAYWLNEPIQWMIYLFYNLFVLRFLQIKFHNKTFYQVVKGLNIFYILYAVFQLLFVIITFDRAMMSQMFLVSRIFLILVAFYVISSMLITVKTSLTKYIVIGSTLFLVFAVTSMLYGLQVSWLPPTKMYPISFMQIGILLEVVFFTWGLSHRAHVERVEKEKLQQAYIKELEKNERISKRANKELTDEVNSRIKEIKTKTEQLEEERDQKLRVEFEKQLMESEMKALRMQMNPHFIFNSLNAIRYLILKEDTERASDYLTSFSKLLRLVLQHSTRKYIKLKEELEALELYLEFEKERYEGKFDYRITLGQGLDSSVVEIQPLIIQPFVETAIWQSLVRKNEKNHLSINISQPKEKVLQIIIEEDSTNLVGVGQYKHRIESESYKSTAMRIINERLRLIQKLDRGETGYIVEDHVDDEGGTIGYRIILKITLL